MDLFLIVTLACICCVCLFLDHIQNHDVLMVLQSGTTPGGAGWGPAWYAGDGTCVSCMQGKHSPHCTFPLAIINLLVCVHIYMCVLMHAYIQLASIR